MPIYDYVCEACGHRFEVLHGLNESGPHQCPVCGGAVKRVFAPPAIVFKGSGWAKTDRRYSGAPQKRKGEGNSGRSSEAGASTDGTSKEGSESTSGSSPSSSASSSTPSSSD